MVIITLDITLDRWHLRAVRSPTGETALRADESVPGADAVLERLDLSHGRVALRVPDGRYLARHTSAGSHATRTTGAATRGLHLVEELTACAAFEEMQQPGGLVSLRGCDLRFLGATANGDVVGNRVADGSWERFGYLEVPVAPRPAAPLAVPSQAGPTIERVALAPV